jgi:hypothetical protein
VKRDPMESKLSKLPWGGYTGLRCSTPYCSGHGGKCAVCGMTWSDCLCMFLDGRCRCNNMAEGSPFLWKNIKLRFQWLWKAVRQRSLWVDTGGG